MLYLSNSKKRRKTLDREYGHLPLLSHLVFMSLLLVWNKRLLCFVIPVSWLSKLPLVLHLHSRRLVIQSGSPDSFGRERMHWEW